MKHFLIFLSALAVTVAFAQQFTTKKEVQCDTTEAMFLILKGQDYEEKPVWLGKGDGQAPNYSLLVNPETKSWTIIQFNNDVACVIGAGEDHTFAKKKPYL